MASIIDILSKCSVALPIYITIRYISFTYLKLIQLLATNVIDG